MALNKTALAVAILLAAAGSAPALGGVKEGVEAWSEGDYTLAVREWEGPAAAGDADAMFNLGQAYRLGRGVSADKDRAESFYSRAAEAGHMRAADTYGLMLFQEGRREEALPYVLAAARRGDPRAEYLLGISHFNGDIVERDWVRAYAFVTLANSAGLPQAAPAIAEMDRAIPIEQRQEAAGLAVRLREEAQSTRATELAAAELGTRIPPAGPVEATPEPVRPAAMAVPRAIRSVPISPSAAAARAAIADANRADGTEDPASAGATFALGGEATRPEQATVRAPEPVLVAAINTPVPVVSAQPVPQARASTTAQGGPWRVQLGAFSVAGNAERLWKSLSGRAELMGRERLMIPAGRVTKLQAGGFPDRAAADAACRSLKRSGQECLVTRS